MKVGVAVAANSTGASAAFSLPGSSPPEANEDANEQQAELPARSESKARERTNGMADLAQGVHKWYYGRW